MGVLRREEAADGRCDPVYILRACTGSWTGAAGGKREASALRQLSPDIVEFLKYMKK